MTRGRAVGLRRRLRRVGRGVFGRAMMGVWVLLPLFPVLGAAVSWWLGVR